MPRQAFVAATQDSQRTCKTCILLSEAKWRCK